ncbi:hypothetical protein FF011L_34410 [Roseimaritima multifibrata]|uniref:Ice-binding protein C-terminal domain-containing protein n=1 Tax=Roseimaritima multifibrata TaxID=1930274 RepID=A0A517MIE4_9BACT|nr:DVUA0089 family protein [Roseimaritima multifibrata]QDS94661.1 hypothetical protein FF011L_34410 [Roseimaritima multifibrata]
MKRFIFAFACLTMLVTSAEQVQAGLMNFSFTGVFGQDDDVLLFDFSVGAPSTVTLKTLSYAGGTNSEGNIISAGGFDPILSLFNSSGNLIGTNDDGSFPDVGIDPVTSSDYDTFLSIPLAVGDYTVAVSQFDNFFTGGLGDHISLGFLHEGNPNFTFDEMYGSNPFFNDVNGDARTAEWAFDILNVDSASAPGTVPEPTSLAILGFGALVFVVGRDRRVNRNQSAKN